MCKVDFFYGCILFIKAQGELLGDGGDPQQTDLQQIEVQYLGTQRQNQCDYQQEMLILYSLKIKETNQALDWSYLVSSGNIDHHKHKNKLTPSPTNKFL